MISLVVASALFLAQGASTCRNVYDLQAFAEGWTRQQCFENTGQVRNVRIVRVVDELGSIVRVELDFQDGGINPVVWTYARDIVTNPAAVDQFYRLRVMRDELRRQMYQQGAR